MCIFTENIDLIFFLREQLELTILIYFIYKTYYSMHFVCNLFNRNDREAIQSDIFLTVNVQVFDYMYMFYRYLIMVFCPIAHYNGIASRYVQYCQAMLKLGVCELAHFFFLR